LGALILVVGGVAAVKDALAKAALIGGVQALTGLPVHVQALRVSVLKSVVEVQGFVLDNPPGFPERVMVDMPELVVAYRLGPLFARRLHLKTLRLHLKEIAVIRDRQGRLNLEAIQAVQGALRSNAEQGSAGVAGTTPSGTSTSADGASRPFRKAPQPLAVQIDELDLRIGRVVYKDYSRSGSPLVQEFSLNLHERHRHITHPAGLAALIVSKALVHTTIGRLTSFDLGALKAQVGGVLERATEAGTPDALLRKAKHRGSPTGVPGAAGERPAEAVGGAAGAAVGETVESLKQLLQQ
jgi:hypothetical protein